MARRKPPGSSGDILSGTLDMLILRTLLFCAAHGHTIAHAIEHISEDVLHVDHGADHRAEHALQGEHGSLCPALYRLEDKGLIAGFWGTSESNRRAKYYR